MHIQSVLARGFAQPELIHIGISRQDGERQLASYRPIRRRRTLFERLDPAADRSAMQ
jgi:hypothetical protein